MLSIFAGTLPLYSSNGLCKLLPAGRRDSLSSGLGPPVLALGLFLTTLLVTPSLSMLATEWVPDPTPSLSAFYVGFSALSPGSFVASC